MKGRDVFVLPFVQYKFSQHHFKEHFHKNYSMGLIIDGAHQLRINNSKSTILKNELKIVNPYDIHIANGALSWTYLNIMPSDSSIREIAQEINDDEIFGEIRFENHIKDPLANQLFINLFRKLNHKMAYEEEFISLISYLLQEHSHIALRPKEIPVNIQKALEYIHTYFLDEISLDTLAVVAGISKYHLVKTFKEKTALTPHQYIMRLRIDYAVTLMSQHNDLSLSMIALECGFSDQSHFIKTFKKYNGYTPSILTKSDYDTCAST